eukprot:TRINITY_DN16478_c0_g1_i1.p2 TRINITY_DN16478_c0_g1~~TRINITY_DN16478_c0_g1_i1.p2  ORF type:complete len:138 (-),score=12.31 TRINITY_DN16478_c0_g1_i1:188-601(-)
MLISRLKEICVASLCRCVSTGTMEKERHLVKHLQKLSLLRPSNNLERWTMDDELQAKYLREGIQFCSRLLEIDLSDVEPLYQLNENRPIVMREDLAGKIPSRAEVLSNAPRKTEEYFIAPPIPATVVRHNRDSMDTD